MNQTPRPPRAMERLLAAVLPPTAVGRSIVGDLREEFAQRARLGARRARSRARWWYRRQALGIVARALVGDYAGTRHRGITPASPGRGDPMWRNAVRDVRLAVRALAKAPRFTLIAGLTLALGIGANTAIFSVVDGVLLEPLEYPASEELVGVWSHAPGLGYDQFGLSPDIYFFYRAESSALADLGLYQGAQASLTGEGEPERVDAARVTRSIFSTLAVEPTIGRTFTEEDDRPEAEPVMVIGHDLWVRRYASDPSVLGRTEQIDGQLREIVGVMPERFGFPNEAEVWLPAGFDPESPPIGSFTWNSVGRLAPGFTHEQAQAQLVPLVGRIIEINAESGNYAAFLENGQYAPRVNLHKEDEVGSLATPLWILLGTVGIVLLIACANVANLVLIRAEGAQRSTAIRSALGAGRSALLRQHLAESVVLSVLGGVLGLAVAWGGTQALLRFAPPQIPRIASVGVDGSVLGFALAATALAALLFGLVPAIRYTRPEVMGTLRQGVRGGARSRGDRFGRGLLVVGQTAMALILLVGSGLLVRSFAEIWRTDPGFSYEDVMTFQVAIPQAGYPTPADVAAFHAQLRTTLAAIPGVESVGATTGLPLTGTSPGTAHEIDGRETAPGELPPLIHYKGVLPGYFESLRITRLTGSVVQPGDEEREARSVVINRALADSYWPDEEALGQRLRPLGGAADWYTIVGIVESVRGDGLRQEPRALVYYTISEQPGLTNGRNLTYALRGPGVASQGAAIRAAVWSLDSDLPVARMETMEKVVSDSIVQLSFTMLTLGVAALLALVLGAIGLYGVLSYAVSQRSGEIGVRMALGAERATVMRMVVSQGARLAILGLVVGVAGSIGLTKVLQGLLFGTEPLDPITFVGTSVMLLAVALLASYLPARRAAAMDPMESIRTD